MAAAADFNSTAATLALNLSASLNHDLSFKQLRQRSASAHQLIGPQQYNPSDCLGFRLCFQFGAGRMEHSCEPVETLAYELCIAVDVLYQKTVHEVQRSCS